DQQQGQRKGEGGVDEAVDAAVPGVVHGRRHGHGGLPLCPSRYAAPSARPATASSFPIMAGSRAAGGVMMAWSRQVSIGLGVRGGAAGSAASAPTSARALPALAISTAITSLTSTGPCDSRQQS